MSQEAAKLITNIKTMILNPIIAFMFALATVVFIYGVVEYILGAENADKVEEGKKHMIYGIIGIFVMLAVYGILNLLSDFWFKAGSGY